LVSYFSYLALLLTVASTSVFADGSAKEDEHVLTNSAAALLAPQVVIPIILNLREVVQVQGERIVLSDVAECFGARLICDEMYGVDLGKSPDLGKSIRIKKEVIAELAKSEWPKSKIELRGAEIVKIASLTFEITSRDLEVAMQRTLDEKLGSDSRFKITVQVAHLNRNMKIVGSDNYFAFPEVAAVDFTSLQTIIKTYAGTRRFEVQIHSSQSREIQLTTKVSFTMQVELYVPVSERDMPRGASISSGKFSEKWIGVLREQDPPIIKISAFTGFKLNRRVLAGDPIRESYLERPLVVKKGDMVNVHLSNGDVEITSKGKATKDGGVGENIDVILIGTQKRAAAKIVAKNEVLMQ
jgi:flagella basal body P-ring formation protein FlgA